MGSAVGLADRQFVFGYGSLAAPSDGPALTRAPAPHGLVCDLRGFRRQWGVAMDNSRDLPGYKHYTDPAGTRPAVFVCFLDIVADRPGALVNGLCLPVDSGRLARLDARERNYSRVDVSDRVDAGGARVWAYVGSREARLRMRFAVGAGRAVIDGAYLRSVADGLRALGTDEYAAAAPSLAPGTLPVVELVRHDHR